MTRSTRYDVPTKVLLDQCRVTLDTLAATSNAAWLTELKHQGLDSGEFMRALKNTYEVTIAAEATQEHLKEECAKEARDNQAAAEEGYRWLQRVQARGRNYLATEDVDPADIAGKLRFGKLHNSRARSVMYEMRVILPELADIKATLKPYGLTDALINEGRALLKRLSIELTEAADADTRRRAATKKVREAELTLTRLLDRLLTADESAALERPENEPHFRLDLINAERARVEAMRKLRVAKQPADATTSANDD